MKKHHLLLLILLIPIITNATSGRLQKGTVKTCPDGVTYGKHGDGHWHVALVDSSNNYYASGDPIGYDDPCPISHQNQGTAEHTSPPEQTSPSEQNNGATNNDVSERNNVVVPTIPESNDNENQPSENSKEQTNEEIESKSEEIEKEQSNKSTNNNLEDKEKSETNISDGDFFTGLLTLYGTGGLGALGYGLIKNKRK